VVCEDVKLLGDEDHQQWRRPDDQQPGGVRSVIPVVLAGGQEGLQLVALQGVAGGEHVRVPGAGVAGHVAAAVVQDDQAGVLRGESGAGGIVVAIVVRPVEWDHTPTQFEHEQRILGQLGVVQFAVQFDAVLHGVLDILGWLRGGYKADWGWGVDTQGLDDRHCVLVVIDFIPVFAVG